MQFLVYDIPFSFGFSLVPSRRGGGNSCTFGIGFSPTPTHPELPPTRNYHHTPTLPTHSLQPMNSLPIGLRTSPPLTSLMLSQQTFRLKKITFPAEGCGNELKTSAENNASRSLPLSLSDAIKCTKKEGPFKTDFLLPSFPGTSFLCHISVCPVKDRAGHVALIILDFDDPAERLKKSKLDGGGGAGGGGGGGGGDGADGEGGGGGGGAEGAWGKGKELLVGEASKCTFIFVQIEV